VAQRKLSVAIVGAGMGGLTAAAALRRVGVDAQIYEQAPKFARLGAGIQQSPNSVRVLRALGLESRLRELAFQPPSMKYRDSASGDLLWERMLGDEFEQRYGAPHLLLHRGDLHMALTTLVPDEVIHRSKKLTGFDSGKDGVTLRFADGSSATADALIAADGVHSIVREQMLGPEKPRFTGKVAYRTTFPARLLNGLVIDDATKWIGPDRHIVIYYINPRRDEVYFVTSTPEPDYDVESWSTKGDMAVLRHEYRDFHPQVRGVLEACPEAHKWALVDRDPLPRWTDGRVVLLGDACHPMTPYMAQGAATAIEDAAFLSRCLAEVDTDGVAAAFRAFEAARKPRTSRIQEISSLNSVEHLKAEIPTIYGYDAWTAPIPAAAAPQPALAS
jgi:salicylate hydroxylase/6-hydroxynicotinate 3-monooxygenase